MNADFFKFGWKRKNFRKIFEDLEFQKNFENFKNCKNCNFRRFIILRNLQLHVDKDFSTNWRLFQNWCLKKSETNFQDRLNFSRSKILKCTNLNDFEISEYVVSKFYSISEIS